MHYNPITSVFYQTYLLQLEEYNLKRFNAVVQMSAGKTPTHLRKQIIWTPKLIGVFALAHFYRLLFALGIALFFFPLTGLFFAVVVFIGFMYISALLFFLPLTLALYTISPVDTLVKKSLINSAKKKLESYQDLKIIGIAGSFGKTTMKEVLATVLAEKFIVLKTPKNINTPLGISRQITTELNHNTEIYIVEMGEYYPGDVATICAITPPHVAVVTGINEAHLEKMGTIENTVKTIFEIVENSKPDSTVILNGDSPLVVKNYKQFVGNRKVLFFSKQNPTVTFHTDTLSISFEITQKGKDPIRVQTKILGEYIVGDILAAFEIGQLLGMTLAEMSRGMARIQPVEHRLQPIYNASTDVLVIDDSYNGNPDGVQEAIKVLSYFKRRRRVFITPGLVETAEKNREIHYTIGKELSAVADKVILIKNSATPYISEGLLENGFKKEDIIWFESAKEAHSRLGEIIKPKDVVLFQNDWPDNYF